MDSDAVWVLHRSAPLRSNMELKDVFNMRNGRWRSKELGGEMKLWLSWKPEGHLTLCGATTVLYRAFK